MQQCHAHAQYVLYRSLDFQLNDGTKKIMARQITKDVLVSSVKLCICIAAWFTALIQWKRFYLPAVLLLTFGTEGYGSRTRCRTSRQRVTGSSVAFWLLLMLELHSCDLRWWEEVCGQVTMWIFCHKCTSGISLLQISNWEHLFLLDHSFFFTRIQCPRCESNRLL